MIMCLGNLNKEEQQRPLFDESEHEGSNDNGTLTPEEDLPLDLNSIQSNSIDQVTVDTPYSQVHSQPNPAARQTLGTGANPNGHFTFRCKELLGYKQYRYSSKSAAILLLSIFFACIAVVSPLLNIPLSVIVPCTQAPSDLRVILDQINPDVISAASSVQNYSNSLPVWKYVETHHDELIDNASHTITDMGVWIHQNWNETASYTREYWQEFESKFPAQDVVEISRLYWHRVSATFSYIATWPDNCTECQKTIKNIPSFIKTHYNQTIYWTIHNANRIRLHSRSMDKWSFKNYDILSDALSHAYNITYDCWSMLVSKISHFFNFIAKSREGYFYLPTFVNHMNTTCRSLYNKTDWPSIDRNWNRVKHIAAAIATNTDHPRVVDWILDSGFSIYDFLKGPNGGLKNLLGVTEDIAVGLDHVNPQQVVADAKENYKEIFNNLDGPQDKRQINQHMTTFAVNSIDSFLDLWISMRDIIKPNVISHWEIEVANMTLIGIKASGIDLYDIIKKKAGIVAAKMFKSLSPESLVKGIVFIKTTPLLKNFVKPILNACFKGIDFDNSNQHLYIKYSLIRSYLDTALKSIDTHLPPC